MAPWRNPSWPKSTRVQLDLCGVPRAGIPEEAEEVSGNWKATAREYSDWDEELTYIALPKRAFQRKQKRWAELKSATHFDLHSMLVVAQTGMGNLEPDRPNQDWIQLYWQEEERGSK